MHCMAVANTCFAHCLNWITPFQPTAGSQSLADLLSHTVKTLWMCHCLSCDLLEMHQGWLLSLEHETGFFFLILWQPFKPLSRTAACLVGFPWKGKIVLLASLKHFSAMMLARNPNQYCCLPCYLVSGNILICLVLCCGITSIPSKPTHWFCSDVYVIQDAGIWLKTVSCMYSNTTSRKRRELCSLQLLREFSVLLLIWLSFFPFAPPIFYFIHPSQNSLFPLQAVNLMHAAASLPHALHFLPSWLTFLVLIRQLMMVMFCQVAGWPRGICRQMLEPILSMYLLFLLVFCCLFFPVFLKIIMSLDPAA